MSDTINLNPETVFRYINLANEAASGQDLALLLENKGAPVEGESTRQYEDGKPRLEALGYMLMSSVEIAPGASTARISTSALVVVRQCDAASASIASLLKSQTENLKVVLSNFKAGGDQSSKDMQPTLEIQIDQGRVISYAILTPSSLHGMPCEVVGFAHQGLEIRSAPQTRTGQRGAVRTCAFNG